MTTPVYKALVSVQGLVVTYSRRRGAGVEAVRGVSLEIRRGETLGMVGESGAGKTTVGRVLLGLERPTGGAVLLRNEPLAGRGAVRRLRGRLQVVPQNPDWSLNPHLRVWRCVAEPLVVAGSVRRRDRPAAVDSMLERVGLDPALAQRRPHQLSGGQRQRVAIARAIIANPDFIVFDEAVTALDVSVQTQVLNLIRELQHERGFAALFISHDLAAVRYVADRIAVMQQGRVVEIGPAERFYGQPAHPYSRQLMTAMMGR